MLDHYKFKKYFLTHDEYEQCKEFAEKVVKTNISKYRERNQYDTNTIKHQIISGKLGEIILCKDIDIDYNEYVDFKIYKGKDKKFSPDIIYSDINIHAKSVEVNTMERYNRTAWVFQYDGDGAGNTDTLLFKQQPNDYIGFSIIDFNGKMGWAVGYMWAKFLKLKLLFGYPDKPELRATKRLIDLYKIENNFLISEFDDVKNDKRWGNIEE